MILYPALDLLDGRVVRLEKGDFAKVTEFQKSPLEWMKSFETIGVSALHLVDLSGAKDPQKRQSALFKELTTNRDLKIQVGGGIRTLPDIESLLSSGVHRIVLGSVLFSNPQLVMEAARIWGFNHFTLAFDVLEKNGIFEVKTHGWTEGTGQDLLPSVQMWQDQGFNRILCTDISCDGMMSGPNIRLYEKLQSQFPQLEIQASGGVSSTDDLEKLKSLSIHSVIIGRSFLSGKISLQEALSLCSAVE